MASDECDDLEEDVILPNSPLYCHFKEDTPSDTSVSDAGKQKTQSQTTFFNRLASDCVSSAANACKWTITCFTDPVYNLFRCQHNSVQRNYYDHIVNMVTSSSAMIQEDMSFLKAFSSEMPPASNSKVNMLLWVALPSLAVALLLGSYCGTSDDYELAFKNNVTWVLGRKTMFFMSSFILTFFFSYCMLSVNHRLKFRSLCKKLKNLCGVSKDLVNSFKMCFKIIQEAELVARGFTISDVVGSVQRLELAEGLPVASPKRQLPEFRKILFTWTKETFFVYRCYTLGLIKFFPLSVDCISSYFATTPIKEFGRLLEPDVNTSEGFEELLQVSDNLSLSSLKAMYQLALVQISEFLRRFCLSLSGELDHEVVNYCSTFQKLEFLVKSMEELIEHDKQLVSTLKGDIMFYRSGEEFSPKDENPIKSDFQGKSPIHDFVLSLHSFNLHLKAVLRKGVTLEDFVIDKKMATCQNDRACLKLIKSLETSLNELKDEFASCNGCLEDCYECLHKMNGQDKGSNKAIDTVLHPDKEDRDTKNESPKKQVLITDSNPVIEDEVFEAVIKETDCQEKSSEEFYDADDITGSGKIDRKTSANLMKELKTVLVVKAEEHRHREEIAIRAKAAKGGGQSVGIQDKPLLENHSGNQEYDRGDIHGAHGHKVDSSGLEQYQSEFNLIEEEEPGSIPSDSEDSLPLKFSFNPIDSGGFAASIAALAAQRQKTLNLESSTFEFGSDSDTQEED